MASDWPKNGYNIASTFSGAGGSSFGYRIAGFNVQYANEFVETAAKSYEANMPSTFVDRRDIRLVKGSEILEKCGGKVDVFDGSPPCQPFSTAGAGSRRWGVEKSYGDHSQRADDLFDEYLRLVDEIQPKVFVAENVAGMTKGTAKGIFIQVMQQLRKCGYQVEARLLDASWLGTPQRRIRTIIVGVRDDLQRQPRFPDPLPYQYHICDALPALSGADIWIGREQYRGVRRYPAAGLMPTITLQGSCLVRHLQISLPPDSMTNEGWADPVPPVGWPKASEGHPGRRLMDISEIKLLAGFPADYTFDGTYIPQWERIGNSVPPPMACAIGKAVAGVLDNASVS